MHKYIEMKKSRFVLLSLLLSLFTYNILAQHDAGYKKYIPSYDISVAIGDPMLASFYTDGYFLFRPYYDPKPFSFDDYVFGPEEYAGNTYITPVISTKITYQAASWYKVGGAFGYFGYYAKKHDVFTDAIVRRENTHVFLLMPEMMLLWLNESIIQLYSGAGLGIAITMKEKLFTNEPSKNGLELSLLPTYHLNIIGARFGKELFGFVEYGVGFKGMFSAGIGYKFVK